MNIANENKLLEENINLTQRLKMLEDANEKRKIVMLNIQKPVKRKQKKKHRKNRMYPPLPPSYPGVPFPHQMYGGGMPGQLNYPLYHNNGSSGMYAGGYGGYPGNNMSALAGAGLNALNMTPNNYYGGDQNYHSQMPHNPAEFENRSKIIDGRDINDDNKEHLKLLLSQQLGQANRKSHRDRPPSYN